MIENLDPVRRLVVREIPLMSVIVIEPNIKCYYAGCVARMIGGYRCRISRREIVPGQVEVERDMMGNAALLIKSPVGPAIVLLSPGGYISTHLRTRKG